MNHTWFGLFPAQLLALFVLFSKTGLGCAAPALTPAGTYKFGQFAAAVALKANNVWGVGSYFPDNGRAYTEPLIEHWDGTAWDVVPNPFPSPQEENFLSGLAASSRSDLWAVGQYSPVAAANPVEYIALTEHWDGVRWAVVPCPHPGRNSILNSAASVDRNDAWAVGGWGTNPFNPTSTLAVHWDGSVWSVSPTPSPGVICRLWDVAAFASDNVWAVGFTQSDPSEPQQALALQWDGQRWDVVWIGAPPPGESNLTSVAVDSTGTYWVAGWARHNDHFWTVSGHGSGTSFTWDVSSIRDATFGEILVLPDSEVWAVGSSYDPSTNQWGTLAARWNGSSWEIVPTPNRPAGPGLNYLSAVAGVSTSDLWAFGEGGDGYSLIEHWDGTEWSIIPSP